MSDSSLEILPVLPPLRPDGLLRAADRRGEWVDVGDTVALDQLASSISVESRTNMEAVLSVPDVWAHVELFRAALLDTTHAKHAQATREWRGLLAVFALRPFYDVALGIARLDIPEPKREGTVTRPDFFDVAARTLPVAATADGLSWRHLGIIRVSDQVVGLLVPSTIVVPTKNRANLPPGLPWIRDGNILDPSAVEDVQRAELVALRDYVAALLEAVPTATHDDITRRTADGVRGALRQYELQIVERLKGEAQTPELRSRPVASTLETPSHPIFAALAIGRIVDVDEEQYDVALKVRPEAGLDLKGALILDPAIAPSFGRSPDKIIAWGITSLARLAPERRTSDELRSHIVVQEASKAGFACLTADDIFLPELSRMTGRRVETHGSLALGEFVLPFSSAILLFLTPAELVRATRIERTADGYVVSLELTLHSSRTPKKPVTVVLQRKYAQKDALVEAEAPVTILQWPNFVHPNWRWNYIFTNVNAQLQFAVLTPVSVHTLARSLTSATNGTERLNQICAWKRHPPRVEHAVSFRSDLVGLYLTEQAAEAMVLGQTRLGDLAANAGAVSERPPAGLLLFPQHPLAQSRDKRAAIGVDFGTSNTCVFIRGEDGEPRPLTFGRRLVSPFKTVDDATEQFLSEFIPNREIEAPFQTVLRDRGYGHHESDIPFWADHIFFPGRIEPRTWGEVLRRESGRGNAKVHFNLKWNDGRSDLSHVRRFIGQLAIMAAAEALSADGVLPQRIDWKFSYPEAFTQHQLKQMLILYRGGARFALGPPWARLEPEHPDVRVPDYETESLTAALYFHKRMNATLDGTAITLDIGGGTSDICIWQSSSLLWRNSLRLAGRDFVSGLLAADLVLLEKLLPITSRKPATGPQITGDQGKPRGAETVIETLRSLEKSDVRRDAVELLLNMPDVGREMSDNLGMALKSGGTRLMLLVEFVLGALLYFIGLQIRMLVEKGRYDPERRIVRIYLGGRASRMFAMLYRDMPETLTNILKLLPSAAGLAAVDTEIEFTRDPKSEVAYGLLVDKPSLQLDGRERAMVAGEQLRSAKTVLPMDATVADSVSLAGLRIGESADQLPGIHAFFELLRTAGKIKVSVPDKVWGDIIKAANKELQIQWTEARADEEPVGDTNELQPAFIILIRQIVAKIVSGDVSLSEAR